MKLSSPWLPRKRRFPSKVQAEHAPHNLSHVHFVAQSIGHSLHHGLHGPEFCVGAGVNVNSQALHAAQLVQMHFLSQSSPLSEHHGLHCPEVVGTSVGDGVGTGVAMGVGAGVGVSVGDVVDID